MNFATIKFYDISNGPGVRTSLYVSGCTHHCRNCFNPMTWDFAYGESFTRATEDRLLESCTPGYISGITLLGGEPMEPENQRALLPFLRRGLPRQNSVVLFRLYLRGADRRVRNPLPLRGHGRAAFPP